MGFGNYSHEAHLALTRGRSAAAAPVFTQAQAHPLLSPKNTRRECRDSADHPDTLGIVFALDVTGSMGRIPAALASATLPTFMASLEAARITDPQLCFMAIGHPADRSPLQVGQFESTAALIDGWLTRLHLEGGGVGKHEGYELGMWYAAQHMALDCVEKRGRRGFLFLTVDTLPNPALSRLDAARILGETLEHDVPIRDVIDVLQRRFEPFVLIAPGSARGVERAWRDLLGDRVVLLQHHEDVAHVAAGLIALLEGAAASLTVFVDQLTAQGMGRRKSSRIARALVCFAASIHRDGAPLPGSAEGRIRLPLPRASGIER